MCRRALNVKGMVTTVISNLFRYAFLICVSYVLLYPFFFIIVNSIKNLSDAYDSTVNWIPKSLYFGNFISAIKVFDVKHSLLNTLIYEIVSSLIQFASCSVAAYG